MATLGKPAVNDPREFTLREVQQVVSNIRQRLGILDSTLATVQTIQQVGAQTAAVDLAAVKRSITNLQNALTALTAVVAALEVAGSETDPRTEQMAGELMALQAELSGLSIAGPGRLPQVEAQVAQMQQQIDAVDTVGQTPVHAALLQGLQRQVGDINCGVLI